MTTEAFFSAFHPRRFDRAAASYEASASVQDRLAGVLLELWGEEPPPARILEFGCGTGLLTRKMRARFPAGYILATDAAPRMLDLAGARFPQGDNRPEFAILDAEGNGSAQAPLSVPPFDLIASNALVQWFPDPEKHLRLAALRGQAGAAYLVSGFSRSNFPELNALLAAPPFSYRSFPGHDPEALKTAAAAAGWETVKLRAWEEKEILPTPRDVLQRIRALGSARDPREGGKMNRKNLETLLRDYAGRFAEPEGVRLTWRPWAALLRRP